jgi:hypothetical protein
LYNVYINYYKNENDYNNEELITMENNQLQFSDTKSALPCERQNLL